MTGARKPRNYAAEYAKRKARSERIGRGLGIEGLSPKGLAAIRKRNGLTGTAAVVGPRPQHADALERWGVSARQVEDMNLRNLEYSPSALFKKNARSAATQGRLNMAYAANAYNDSRGGRPGDYSEDRVAYVVTFYRAVVDPRTNYDSLMGVDSSGRKTRRIRNGKPLSNKWQREYLTRYAQWLDQTREEYLDHAGIMDVDEYEQRYGMYN